MNMGQEPPIACATSGRVSGVAALTPSKGLLLSFSTGLVPDPSDETLVGFGRDAGIEVGVSLVREARG